MSINKETLHSLAIECQLEPVKVEQLGNKFIIDLGNSDYLHTEKFQLSCTELVRENREQSIYICCSHPHCFTMGRGLQKKSGAVLDSLIETNLDKVQLPFPLYQIKRGGGLTFHYPGQFILYPIVNLNLKDNNLKDLVNWLLGTIQAILEDSLGISGLIKKTDPLGLWLEDSKLASIGIASNRFVTYHGLALNLNNDQKMFSVLQTLNPCGLNGSIYTNVERLTDKAISQSSFTELFVKHLS